MVDRIDAFSGTLSLMNALANPSAVDAARSDALTDETPAGTVDTCVAFDTGKWETGIERDGSFIIVEQYDSKEEAVAAHSKWLSAYLADPDMELSDINVWDI